MQDFRQEINARASIDLEQRRTWYSPVADVYYNARAHYPKKLIDRSVALAQLSSNASILEVGCGPGNATVNFAQFGFSMTCIEPNQDFCHLAQHNCDQYPKVTICNTSFEEWELEAKQFNAVLSANAFHWIPPEIRYTKAAAVIVGSHKDVRHRDDKFGSPRCLKEKIVILTMSNDIILPPLITK